MANESAAIDQALDEVLVQLGGMVLTLASPKITRTIEQRQALARSVNQYAVCAAISDDPRVKELKTKLDECLSYNCNWSSTGKCYAPPRLFPIPSAC